MDSTDLAQFRAQWREEVAGRQPRRAPALLPQPRVAEAHREAPRRAVRVAARAAERDTLTTLLATLVPAHERAAADGALAQWDTVHAALAPPPGLAQEAAEAAGVRPRPPATAHAFHAEDTDAPIPAARLPDEVWRAILRHMILPTHAPPPSPSAQDHMTYRSQRAPRLWTSADYAALERIARVCWKFRLLTAHATLWR